MAESFYDATPGKKLPTGEVVTIVDVEAKILQIDAELEELVHEHYSASQNAAEAAADWKMHKSRVAVSLANEGKRSAEDFREAKALVSTDRNGTKGEDLYRRHLMTEAEEKSVEKHMRALMARLSGLQSIARGLRSATGLE
jgi:hypothetical protein